LFRGPARLDRRLDLASPSWSPDSPTVTLRVRTPHALTASPAHESGGRTPLWDRIIVIIFQLLFMAILIVGGLD